MYINLNRIEFMVTYNCSGKCRHCSVSDKLNTGKHMHVDGQSAAKAIKKLSEMFDIESVMTFGGEPLLYPDTVCAIHKQAAECGINARQLITNGYFNKDKDQINKISRMLVQSGVNDILLSVDAFHQQYIPIEYVREFAKCSLEAGISVIRLQPAWVVNSENDNIYNETTRDILAGLLDLGIETNEGNNIFMAGNAVKYLSEYYEKPELDLKSKCGQIPYTSPLTEISSISVVPNGDVMVCSFTIGNIYDENIESKINRYNPCDDEYMKVIVSNGVQGLIDLAEERGICVNLEDCYSICDACRKLVTAMKDNRGL